MVQLFMEKRLNKCQYEPKNQLNKKKLKIMLIYEKDNLRKNWSPSF